VSLKSFWHRINFYLGILFSLLLPEVAFGQQSPTIGQLIRSALNVLNLLVPFVIGLALVLFLYGVVRYALAGSAEDKSSARKVMLWGIIALFVMVSVWGLVNLLRDALGISTNPNISAPSVPNSDFSSGGPVFGNGGNTSFGQ